MDHPPVIEAIGNRNHLGVGQVGLYGVNDAMTSAKGSDNDVLVEQTAFSPLGYLPGVQPPVNGSEIEVDGNANDIAVRQGGQAGVGSSTNNSLISTTGSGNSIAIGQFH